MSRNSRLCCGTARKDQRAGGNAERQRPRKELTHHSRKYDRDSASQLCWSRAILIKTIRAISLLQNGGSVRPSDFLSACLDHGPLQRALHVLYAARVAGVVAARRNPDF